MLGTEGWMRVGSMSAAALALIVGALLLEPPLASAQQGQQPAAGASVAGDLSWPRGFDVGNDQLEVYQPQIESWRREQTRAVRISLACDPSYGCGPHAKR
jgi:hypothetical protein